MNFGIFINWIKLFWYCMNRLQAAKILMDSEIIKINAFVLNCVIVLQKIHREHSKATLTAPSELDFISNINNLLGIRILETCDKVNSLTIQTFAEDSEFVKLYLTQLIKSLDIFCKKVYKTNALDNEILQKVETTEQETLNHYRMSQRPVKEDRGFKNIILKGFEKTNAKTDSIKSPKKDLFLSLLVLCFFAFGAWKIIELLLRFVFNSK